MKKMKVTSLLNIGTEDKKQYGVPLLKEGEVATVDQEIGELMLKKGWAVQGEVKDVSKIGTEVPTPGATVPGGEGAESPVADENASDAIESIGRMTSREKLQAIIDNDKRSTVTDAAASRLASL